MTAASQLSGVYHPELLQILTEFMEVPVVQDTGSVNVQLLLNDSLQYEIKLVPVSTTTNHIDTLMAQPKNISITHTGFTIQKKFTAKKGLLLSYDPYPQSAQSGEWGSHYILLNKDKQGNLVIKHVEKFNAVLVLFPVGSVNTEWISVRKNTVIYSAHRIKRNPTPIGNTIVP